MRNQDVTARRADEMVVVGLHGDVGPVLEVVGAVLGVDRLDLAFVQQGQRATCRGDLHRLENPVEDEHVTVEHDSPLVTPRKAEVVSNPAILRRVGHDLRDGDVSAAGGSSRDQPRPARLEKSEDS